MCSLPGCAAPVQRNPRIEDKISVEIKGRGWLRSKTCNLISDRPLGLHQSAITGRTLELQTGHYDRMTITSQFDTIACKTEVSLKWKCKEFVKCKASRSGCVVIPLPGPPPSVRSPVCLFGLSEGSLFDAKLGFEVEHSPQHSLSSKCAADAMTPLCCSGIGRADCLQFFERKPVPES